MNPETGARGLPVDYKYDTIECRLLLGGDENKPVATYKLMGAMPAATSNVDLSQTNEFQRFTLELSVDLIEEIYPETLPEYTQPPLNPVGGFGLEELILSGQTPLPQLEATARRGLRRFVRRGFGFFRS